MILQVTRSVQAGLRQERKFELIANHLANADTNGFKAEILSFDEAMRATLTIDHSQGGIRVTHNPLDLALRDDGFFKVETPQGVRYTRNGNFTLNAQGQLVTQNGDLVLGDNGPITIEGTNIDISENGQIEVDGESVDKLQIAGFEALDQLQKEGRSYFVYKGDPVDEEIRQTVSVQQGALETPNVSPVVEMTKMIETHRLFEAYQKVIQSFDEMDSKIINEVGKPG